MVFFSEFAFNKSVLLFFRNLPELIKNHKIWQAVENAIRIYTKYDWFALFSFICKTYQIDQCTNNLSEKFFFYLFVFSLLGFMGAHLKCYGEPTKLRYLRAKKIGFCSFKGSFYETNKVNGQNFWTLRAILKVMLCMPGLGHGHWWDSKLGRG